MSAATAAAVPEILTDRLHLRGHTVDDFPASAAMWADSEVTRFIGGQPLSEEQAWARLLRYAGHWRLLGFGFWVLEERAGGEFAGEAGFAIHKREIDPPMHDVPEIGWVLVPRVHGKGYATEAVRAVLEWGRTNLAARATACLIHPDNVRSVRVAEKCGFAKTCDTVYKNEPAAIYTRPY